jgi:ubiquinone/menaquinone biosynthesis C-methylase UbiE
VVQAPDSARAVRQYEAVAGTYDERLSLRLARGAQRRAVARLELRSGERVLDIACGTGLNFAGIEAGIGPSGTLVGIDLSEEMLDRARVRVRAHGWANVQLVHTAVEEASLDGVFDAAVFSFTHDVLRSPGALAGVVARLGPGARVAAAGVMYPRRLPVRPLVRRAARRYVTTLEGLDCPWSHLEGLLDALVVERLLLGSLYVVSGSVRGEGAPD